ncbi:ankyrin repeat-containing domain protein [Morchella snyderi]|nr:ankyrin repeat-containing domain protein [Morchella snyderi]
MTLDWVSTIQYGEIHSEHCARRTENTCLWLRDNAKFNDWLLSRSSSPVLWLRGNAGTGKTILASFTIELLKKRATSTEDCIAYFYCSIAQPDRSSPDSILRALLRQICVGYSSASDGLPSALVEAKQNKQRESGGLLTVKESEQLIIQLSKQLTGLWIVVDALDECNINSRKELFQALKAIQKDGSNVHVLVTGRNEGDIIAYMKDYEDYHIGPKDNSDDIMLYIRSELDRLYSCPSKSGMVDDMRDHEQDILKALQANVDGMFLSAQLRIQALWHETTIEGVTTTMGVLPQGLETMYDEIFRRIKEQSPTDQGTALKVIQWLFYATDDFSPKTILEALHHNFHTIRKLSEDAIQRKIENILRACCGLTVYDRETGLLRFSHATVLEYLGKGTRECLRGGQEWILDRCFSLLTCSVTERPDPTSLTSARQDLVTYTMRNWGIHLRNCNLTHNWSTFLDPSSTSYIFWACNIGRMIPTLSSPLGKQISLAWTAAFYGLYDIFKDSPFIISPTCKNLAGRTPLHHLAEHGDLTLVGYPGQIFSVVNERDEKCLTPLMLAAKSDKSENVNFMLAIREQDDGRKLGEGNLAICDINARDINGLTALHHAALAGHVSAVESLMRDPGLKINEKTELGETALYLAARKGHTSTVGILLGHKEIEPNFKDMSEKTPLMIAADRGYEEVVKVLIGHERTDANCGSGEDDLFIKAAEENKVWLVQELLKAKNIDINRKGLLGWTALANAANHGFTEILKLLLNEPGVDTEVQSSQGQTALSLAAQRGTIDCLRALLSHGVNVNAANVNGWTPLHKAAWNGYTEILKELLSHGADADARTGDSRTALYHAAQQGSLDCLRALLSHGVNINAAQVDGWTPLHRAAWNGDTEILKELLSHGADADARTGDRRTALYHAALQGSLDCLRALLSHGVNVNAANVNGWTPLHKAAWNGYTEILKELLSHGADADARTGDSRTALYHAAQQGSLDCLRALLSHGVNINAAQVDGWTPLHRAAWNGDTEILKELLSHGADADARTGDRRTALYHAALQGSLDCLRALLSHGVNINAAQVDGWTPLHRAAWEGHTEILKELLSHGADADARIKTSATPLNLAAEKGQLDCLRALLSHGVNVNAANVNGWTPLHRAAWEGHTEILKELLSHGADADARTGDSRTALYHAAQQGSLDCLRALLSHGVNINAAQVDGWTPLHRAAWNGYTEILKELLSHGADADARTRDSRTALYHAAQQGSLDCLRALLSHGVNINAAQVDGWTPLHKAAWEGHTEILKGLLSHGADADARIKTSATPLNLAAEKGQLDCLRALLSHGVNVNAANVNGWTPLHRAAWEGHTEILKELLSHGADADARTKTSATPLYLAAEKGQLDCLRALLSHGVNVNAANVNGWTPLHRAAWEGHTILVSTLLEQPRIDPYGINSHHRPPLMLARLQGRTETHAKLLVYYEKLHEMDLDVNTHLLLAASSGEIRILERAVERGGYSINYQDELGRTALMMAAGSGNAGVVKRLLKEDGIDVNIRSTYTFLPNSPSETPPACKYSGRTALYFACLSRSIETVTALLNDPRVDPAVAGNHGTTPLLSASEHGLVGLFEKILERYDPHDKLQEIDGDGYPHLLMAAYSGKTRIIELVLERGGHDINSQCKLGDTALILATIKGYTDAVELLLKQEGIDVSIANNKGKTAFDIAKEKNQASIMELLEPHLVKKGT